MSEIVLDTLGRLAARNHGLVFYCDDADCRRRLDLTIERAIEIYGPDQNIIRWRPAGIRCAACGCREVECRVQAPNPDGSTGR
ncbi:hypothetical protein [Aurantimonas sp. VKM B-3413]|uniref:hypothetical protein n=1 Tax=Aurantimonas sp. VKM B-3413 TaxID=2779401 RepID=UPI001E3AB162|nr:hypothetical protein [Aurantimonas sp. VKM B-3413]MCB8835914.1 hypothetical protein [Aurantimonas sp. VKM B-3413]